MDTRLVMPYYRIIIIIETAIRPYTFF